MATRRGHKWFAAFYDRLMARAEATFLRSVRADVAGGARGLVLEIGCGTGANFPYYRQGARVVATEPDPYMLARARRRVQQLGRPIALVQAVAEDLPFPDRTFDAAVATLALCSLDDPRRALAEVRRVLRPGGELRFYEHVRYPDGPLALLQDVVTPLWSWFGAGCHPNRNAPRLLQEAGLELVRLEWSRPLPPLPPMCIARLHVLGVARAP
ncbi:MAG: class I SAM-dependent methyltransferase [Dehalococcoidia bacterium]|jgi:ubiquinone/menaquinone biosynthesis C-methylase UbiE|nr:class I SAM-dependent methyltransferase [Dehalococcoidia bacterium]MDW8009702.1 class I SAM-dependent methyltransferase [Chloroflexota bacterium]